MTLSNTRQRRKHCKRKPRSDARKKQPRRLRRRRLNNFSKIADWTNAIRKWHPLKLWKRSVSTTQIHPLALDHRVDRKCRLTMNYEKIAMKNLNLKQLESIVTFINKN